MDLFAICTTCGRYLELDPEAETEAVAAALAEWRDGHVTVVTYDRQPTGWPDQVEGVTTNGHYRVKLGVQPRVAVCGNDAEPWPCSAYLAAAAGCPKNGLDELAEPRT